MPYELQRRSPSTLSRGEHRELSREIVSVRHEVEVAEELVAGIGRVTSRALYEATRHSHLRKMAENIAPDGAEIYAMIAVAGGMEMTGVISRMSRRYR